MVTGCAGFIGQKVALELLNCGDKVIGLDNMNNYYDPTLKEWRLSILNKYPQFKFCKQNIIDFSGIEKIVFDNSSYGQVIKRGLGANNNMVMQNDLF